MAAFTFPAFRRLRDNLGKSDAIIEVNEIAIRHLLSEIQNNDSISKARLEALAVQHGIRVSAFEADQFRSRLAHLYILSVYEESEDFLRSLSRESPRCRLWADRNSTPILTWFWNNISEKDKSDELSALFSICDYYREVRNQFLHSLQKDAELTAKSLLLRELVKQNQVLVRLEAPQPYRSMGFDDLILFTRAIKELGAHFCECLRPETDDELAALTIEHYERMSNRKINTLKRYDIDRRRHAVYSIVSAYCSLSGLAAAPIVDRIMNVCAGY